MGLAFTIEALLQVRRRPAAGLLTFEQTVALLESAPHSTAVDLTKDRTRWGWDCYLHDERPAVVVEYLKKEFAPSRYRAFVCEHQTFSSAARRGGYVAHNLTVMRADLVCRTRGNVTFGQELPMTSIISFYVFNEQESQK